MHPQANTFSTSQATFHLIPAVLCLPPHIFQRLLLPHSAIGVGLPFYNQHLSTFKEMIIFSFKL
jgi:hypothetical protein